MRRSAKPGDVVVGTPVRGRLLSSLIYTVVCLYIGAALHDKLMWWNAPPPHDPRMDTLCRAPRVNGGATFMVMLEDKLTCWRYES